MTRRRNALLIAFFAIVCAYAALFPLLTADTLFRLLQHASNYQASNLFLLLYLELTRLFTSALAVVIAIAVFKRVPSLAFFLLFAAITYEKVFGANGFPGPLQEHLTNALLHHGASPKTLAWLFGEMPWSIWPAAAALLRFSVVFPQPLDAESLEASGREDRRGFMRGSGVAGADIGAAFRRLTYGLLEKRVYAAATLAIAAIVLVVARTVLPWHPLITWLIGGLALCLAITNFRAGYLIATGEDRVRATWIAQAPLVALFLFLASGLLLLIAPGIVPRTAAFLLIMLTPAAIISCLALSVLDRGELDTDNALGRTVRSGSIGVAVTAVFALVYAAGYYALGGKNTQLVLLIAIVVAVLAFPFIRRLADRVRMRILENQA